MLETFCASVHFKSLIYQHEDMPIVQKYRTIIEQASKDDSYDLIAGIITSQSDVQVVASSTPSNQRQQHLALSERALTALHSTHQTLFDHSIPLMPTCHSKHVIGKVTFAICTESTRDCNIFFCSVVGDVVAPGLIQHIVSVPCPLKTSHTNFLFIVEWYATLPQIFSNVVFSSHPDFGVSVWSSKMSPVLEVVPVNHIVCHAILRPWMKGSVLCKALDRVSFFPLLFFPWLIHYPSRLSNVVFIFPNFNLIARTPCVRFTHPTTLCPLYLTLVL
jgi:hypothetical protein